MGVSCGRHTSRLLLSYIVIFFCVLSAPKTRWIAHSDAATITTLDRKQIKEIIPLSVKTSACIVNSTHCNCAKPSSKIIGSSKSLSAHLLSSSKPALTHSCLAPLSSNKTRNFSISHDAMCKHQPCEEQYECDCESFDICLKKPMRYYVVKEIKSEGNNDTVKCVHRYKNKPFKVIGRTLDIYLHSQNGYTLFHNHRQILYGTKDQYKQVCIECKFNDILGITLDKHGDDDHNGLKNGIKLKFINLYNEIRTIDENWKCSDVFHAEWLEKSFNHTEYNWTSPHISTSVDDDDSFDANIPWMFYNPSPTPSSSPSPSLTHVPSNSPTPSLVSNPSKPADSSNKTSPSLSPEAEGKVSVSPRATNMDERSDGSSTIYCRYKFVNHD